ncbi:hypothetical protein, partial [Nonomuraea roseoviolacea]
MRLRWMTSMLGAAAVAAASCAAPPTPMAAAPQPVSSPRRQHPQVSERESPTDVYAHDRPGMLDPKVRNVTPRVYVPNSESGTVDVINPRTFQVVRHFRV